MSSTEKNQPQHDLLFESISQKLNELSRQKQRQKEFSVSQGQNQQPPPQNQSQRLEKIQTQIKKFYDELQGTQEEFRQKILTLENVQALNSDSNSQLKTLTEQLHQERAANSKLSADLAKSLEISLQLQLEIQGLRSRASQIQAEERKFSQSISEKLTLATQEVELAHALRDELSNEIEKAKSNFQQATLQWTSEKETLLQQLKESQDEITRLNDEIESLSDGVSQMQNSTTSQSESMKALMSAAETKMIELKVALDKKALESQDYYSHLQQAMTQLSVAKQENLNLKDYVHKVNQYLQQANATPASAATPVSPADQKTL